MDPLALIEAHATELRALGAQRIGIFGSVARGEATAESDVDVYLKFGILPVSEVDFPLVSLFSACA